MQNKQKAKRLVERFHTKLSDIKMTEQSHAKACDINNIVAQFAKTGILPDSNRQPSYLDVSNIPSTEEAFKIAHEARDAFMRLPSTIRKLIDNDPSQLSKFMLDEKNRDLCIEHGLFNKPEVKKEEKPSVNTPVKTEEVVATS